MTEYSVFFVSLEAPSRLTTVTLIFDEYSTID